MQSHVLSAARLTLAIAILGTTGTAAAKASTIYVDAANAAGPWDGSAVYPFAKIQDGIDAAVDGDSVVVAAGVYVANYGSEIDFNGKAITVRGVSAVIDVSGVWPSDPDFCAVTLSSGTFTGFTIRGSESAALMADDEEALAASAVAPVPRARAVMASGKAVVTRNTITGVAAWSVCPGIFASGNARVTYNTVTRNRTRSACGGITAVERAVVADNTISDNDSWYDASGLSAGGTVTAARNRIQGNFSLGIGAVVLYDAARLSNSTLSQNDGAAVGGIYAVDQSIVENNMINDNYGDSGGGAGGILADGNAVIRNNVVMDNWSVGGAGGIRSTGGNVGNNTVVRNGVGPGCGAGGILMDGGTCLNNIIAFNWARCSYGGLGGAAEYADYNGVFGNTPSSEGTQYGGGAVPGPRDVAADLRFAADGYHLLAASPCVDAGDPTAVYRAQTDIDGQARVGYKRVDIGADEYLGPRVGK